MNKQSRNFVLFAAVLTIKLTNYLGTVLDFKQSDILYNYQVFLSWVEQAAKLGSVPTFIVKTFNDWKNEM